MADHLVMSISPVLIMLLVGSLSFFLIQVFFRGEAIGSVRWVMFWFVLAVVLVSRIGIEQGDTQAAVYGALLAVATWFYLLRVHPAFILGALLLGIVWWCAHQLTRNCTLIDEDEDASGGGLLETAGEPKKEIVAAPAKKAPKDDRRKEKAVPHSPGLSVVYFSLAALPIFGIGQMLIGREDPAARRAAFIYLFVYVASALGLLLATSFLGLRRYLRQRYLEMPGVIALEWVRIGVGTAVLVLAGALLLPRPGGNRAWANLRYHIDHQLRAASNYAMRFSPHGKGEGRAGNETSDQGKKSSDASRPEQAKEKSPNTGESGTPQRQQKPASQSVPENAGQFYPAFRIVFWVAVAIVVGWWMYRKWEVLLEMARAFWAAIGKFFADLSSVFVFQKTQSDPAKIQKRNSAAFQSYHNPFLTGGEDSWTHEKLVFYSFEALQAWAQEKGIQPRPEQTAREFCEEVGSRFPEINAQLYGLSFLYGHAAYGTSAPAKYDLEPVKSLWRFFYRGSG